MVLVACRTVNQEKGWTMVFSSVNHPFFIWKKHVFLKLANKNHGLAARIGMTWSLSSDMAMERPHRLWMMFQTSFPSFMRIPSARWYRVGELPTGDVQDHTKMARFEPWDLTHIWLVVSKHTRTHRCTYVQSNTLIFNPANGRMLPTYIYISLTCIRWVETTPGRAEKNRAISPERGSAKGDGLEWH